MNSEIDEVHAEKKWGKSKDSKLLQHFADFANLFKAFIGCNYLYMSYAFKQSGLWLGVAGVVLITLMTDHCCHMIVKCKRILVDHLVEKRLSDADGYKSVRSGNNSEEEIRNQIECSLSYTDMGRLVLGKPGLVIVNFCLIITQFGYCIAYFIFIGNTLYSMFPIVKYPVSSTGAVINNATIRPNESWYSNHMVNDLYTSNWKVPVLPTNVLAHTKENGTHNIQHKESTSPPLQYLVLVPLPIFLMFALIRKIRLLAPVSAMANISIFIGFLAVTTYTLIGFEVSESVQAYRISTFPVFFGQVTSAFEGIGVIIPIENSMKGTRHTFSGCLHGALFSVATIICGLGILGYLRHGCQVAQMINQNMPLHDIPALVVSATLIVGVLFTFPLQLFPVVEIVEGYFFGKGRIFGPKECTKSNIQDRDESTGLLPDRNGPELGQFDESVTSVSFVVPKSVAVWKRNILRAFLVCTAAGLAVLLRNKFAYIGAFTGAIGSTTLAFILPCIFHIKLKKLDVLTKVKDVLIITIGVVGGCFSLYGVLNEFINSPPDFCPPTHLNVTRF